MMTYGLSPKPLRIQSECPDIPCVIGGEEVRTGNGKTRVKQRPGIPHLLIDAVDIPQTNFSDSVVHPSTAGDLVDDGILLIEQAIPAPKTFIDSPQEVTELTARIESTQVDESFYYRSNSDKTAPESKSYSSYSTDSASDGEGGIDPDKTGILCAMRVANGTIIILIK
eukprot:369111_1